MLKNPAVFYAIIAFGAVALVAGLFMYMGLHYHGKAYVAIALGVVALIAGIAGMFIVKPSAAR